MGVLENTKTNETRATADDTAPVAAATPNYPATVATSNARMASATTNMPLEAATPKAPVAESTADDLSGSDKSNTPAAKNPRLHCSFAYSNQSFMADKELF